MRSSSLKRAFAATSLVMVLILATGQSSRAGEDNIAAFTSFGSGMTLGQAMASGSPAPRVGLGGGAKAGNTLHAPALAGMADAVAGRAGQRVQVGPAGLVSQTYSLAEALADAMWRKRVAKTLYRHTQPE